MFKLKATMSLCLLLLELGCVDEALEHRMRGNVYMRNGKHAEALEAFQAAVTSRPKDGRNHWLLGNALYDSGQPEAAISSYQEAVKLAPGLLSARQELGIALYHAKRTDEALAQFRAILEQDATHIFAMNRAAEIHVGRSEWNKARVFIDAVLRLDGKNVGARTMLARCHSAAGEHGQALDALRALPAPVLASPQIQYEIAAALVAANRHPEALSQLEQLAKAMKPAARRAMANDRRFAALSQTQRFQALHADPQPSKGPEAPAENTAPKQPAPPPTAGKAP